MQHQIKEAETIGLHRNTYATHNGKYSQHNNSHMYMLYTKLYVCDNLQKLNFKLSHKLNIS